MRWPGLIVMLTSGGPLVASYLAGVGSGHMWIEIVAASLALAALIVELRRRG